VEPARRTRARPQWSKRFEIFSSQPVAACKLLRDAFKHSRYFPCRLSPVACKLLTILSVNGIIENRWGRRGGGRESRFTRERLRLSGRSYFSSTSREGGEGRREGKSINRSPVIAVRLLFLHIGNRRAGERERERRRGGERNAVNYR